MSHVDNSCHSVAKEEPVSRQERKSVALSNVSPIARNIDGQSFLSDSGDSSEPAE